MSTQVSDSMVQAPVTRIYHPWPAPVRAARHVDAADLEAIAAWVAELRSSGRIDSAVRFTVAKSPQGPVGVLVDGDGEYPLPRPSYLVFGRGRLEVCAPGVFHRRYHEPVH